MLNKYTLVLFFLLPLSLFAQEMWINEIHYDNGGSDVNEFVEVVIEDTFAGNLANVEVVFYNGNGGGVYLDFNPHPLTTFTQGDTVNGFTIYSKLVSGIQNGAPDGLALVNNGTVVDFISYEGVITATAGAANGLTSTDIGVFEDSSTAATQSLQLSGTANKGSLFTWQTPATATMGSINNGQAFGDAYPRVSSVFPPSGSSGVDTAIPLDIVFSEPVNATTASFSIACPNGPGGFSGFDLMQVDTTHYIMTPNNSGFLFWPGNDTCTVTMIASQITDLDGTNKPLDGNGDGIGGDNFTFTFNTTTDFLPQVDSTLPLDNDILLPVTTDITVNFSEAVNLTSVNAISIVCQGGSVSFSGLPASNVTSVTITPINPFNEGDICTVTLMANLITDVFQAGENVDPLDGNGDGLPGDNYVFGFSIIEPVAEIYEIQGNGENSPLVDRFIRTENNIVTAVSASGFFMQTPDPGDADTETSDGIFVFSSASVSEGDSVNVRGQIVEFHGMTELTAVSSVVINSSGNTLPTAIELDANNPSTLPPATRTDFDNRFEKYEGMLVNVANGVANGGTQFTGEFSATANGVRAIREPGVEFSQTGDNQLPYDLLNPPNPLTSTYQPDIFDENPELFDVDTNGLGGSAIDINGGSTFNASGVMSYSFGSYTLLPKQFNITNLRTFDAVPMPVGTEVTVATQNMLRFFDLNDDPNISDFDENPANFDFAGRVNKASLYFRTIMHAPDIIVLTEIESIAAVQAIATQINTDDNTLSYTAYLQEGNDIGGIDIGFLAKSTVTNITVTQLGKNETLAFNPPMPPELPRPLHDRPPLLLNALVTKGGVTREINVLGVHTRSRSGITSSDRERIRHKHLEQALSIANMVQNLQSPTAALVVMGDFNDFEFSDGYVDVVGEIKGTADATKNLFSSNGNSVVNPTLIDAVNTLPSSERYSFIFRGTIQALDHALLNDVGLAYLSNTTYIRGNVESPEHFVNDYTQTLGLSDHDGLMIYLDINTTLETIFLDGFEE